MLTTNSSSQFPPYHNLPLTLTTSELTNPQQVINDFFGGYHLTEIRHLLKEWLHEAYGKPEPPTENFIYFHDELVRMIEAMWAICQKQTETTDTAWLEKMGEKVGFFTKNEYF